MKDIISRLRSMGSTEWLESGDNIVGCCRDAAAEIERLRAALKEISELGPEGDEIACDSIAAAEAKGDSAFNLYDQGFCEAWRRAGKIARNAYQQSHEPKPPVS